MMMMHAAPRTAAHYGSNPQYDSPYATRYYAGAPTMTRTASGYYNNNNAPSPRSYSAASPYDSVPRTAAAGSFSEYEMDYAGGNGPRTAFDYSDYIPFKSDYSNFEKARDSALYNIGSMGAMGLAGSAAYAAGAYAMSGKQ